MTAQMATTLTLCTFKHKKRKVSNSILQPLTFSGGATGEGEEKMPLKITFFACFVLLFYLFFQRSICSLPPQKKKKNLSPLSTLPPPKILKRVLPACHCWLYNQNERYKSKAVVTPILLFYCIHIVFSQKWTCWDLNLCRLCTQAW